MGYVRALLVALVVAVLVATHSWAWKTGASRAESAMAIEWQAGQLSAWQQAHSDAAAEIQRQTSLAAAAQRQRDQLSTALSEIDRAPLPDPGPCTTWTPSQRLRLDARRDAHARPSAEDLPAGLLPDPVPTDAPHSGEPL